MFPKVRAVVLLTMIIISLGGCGMRRNMRVSREAVERFHAQLDRGDAKGIAAGADASFKAAAAGGDLAALLDRVHRKLGPVRSTSEQSWNYHFDNGVNDTVLVYKTRFAGGDGTETFDYQVDGEKAILRDYKIDSPEVAAPAK